MPDAPTGDSPDQPVPVAAEPPALHPEPPARPEPPAAEPVWPEPAAAAEPPTVAVGPPAPAYPAAPAYPPGWAGAAPPPLPPTGYLYPATGAPASYLGGPAPQRSRAAVIVSVVTAVVVLACLGFGTVSFFALRHLDTTQSVSEPVPTDWPTDLPSDVPTGLPTDEPTDSGGTHDGDLEKYVIDRPATAHAWPKVKAEQALNLTAAAANFADPSQGKLALQRYGFKDGYVRRWQDEDGNYITIRVLRFRDASGGDNFASFYIDANQAGGWGQPKTVPYLDNAAAFLKPKKEKNGLQRTLAVGDADDVVAIALADEPPPADLEAADYVLYSEFNQL